MNPRNSKYQNYGGRGIQICERWNSYQNFLADMGEAPRGMSIDRIDNDGSYSPENCRWATNFQQANNSRKNVVLRLMGQEMTLAQWCRVCGIKYQTAWMRLKRGLTIEQALNPPVKEARAGQMALFEERSST